MATNKSSKARKSSPTRKSRSGNAESSGMKPQAQPPKARPTIMNDPASTQSFRSFSSLLPAHAHPALVGLAKNADAYIGTSDEAKAIDAERQRIEAERKNGITIKGMQLEQAQRVLSDVSITAAAIHHLVIDADSPDPKERGSIIQAIENMTETIALRVDVVSNLLGDPLGWRHFADEFTALTEERVAELERLEKIGGDHE